MINTKIDVESFSLYFGILMLVVFFMMLIDRQKLTRNRPLEITDKTRTFIIDNETYQYNVNITPAFILSFAVGMLSGLFGIGGGTISVPIMILVFGILVQIAIVTSMFMFLFFYIINLTIHIFYLYIFT